MWVAAGFLLLLRVEGSAAILWSDPGATLIYDSGRGRDLLNGRLKRDDSATDTLYFKFRVSPLSDSTTEEYLAGFELFEGDAERLGVGNAREAWAFSAYFNTADSKGRNVATGYVDLRSSNLTPSGVGASPTFEVPRRGIERTIVFKVQYVAGADDLVTVWLNPDLSVGVTEVYQPETLTTRFNANAAFDEIRLRHEGGGDGWVFSDLAIATSFDDFVETSSTISRAFDSSPPFNLQRFTVESWLREPGMPRSSIYALARTAEGYLWMAGEDGLARFDGVRFMSFDTRATTGGGVVQTLFGDSHGALWIGTNDKGLRRYASGQFENFTTAHGLPADSITAITETTDGVVWIGTTAGLVCWHDGGFHEVKGEQFAGQHIKALFADPTNTVWIGVSGKGVYRYVSVQSPKFKLQSPEREVCPRVTCVTDRQLDELLRDPQCLLVDCKGRLWIGAGEDFVLCQDKGEWQRYRLPRQAGRPAVRVLAGESDGTVWCGSGSEGLCQFKEGKLAVLNPTAGMPQASALLVDREGNLWIGSAGSIHLLRRKQCLFLGQAEGLGHGPVSGLAEVAAGVLWTMQPGYGLCRWEGGNFRHLNAFGLSPTDTSAGVMMVTRDGAWIACTNGLLLFRDPQAVSDESLLFELPGVNITSLAEHENGRVWAGTRQGQLWQLNQGCWRMHLQLDPEFAISTLATEPGGLVWAGTDGGGVFLVGESVRRRLRTAERSLPSDAVRALHCDKEGVLWIGTVAGGLTRFWNGVSTTYTTASGLAANSIYAILEDGAGRLWLHDDAGLTCIAKPSASSRSVNVVGTYPMRTGGREEISSVAGGLPMFPKGCNTRAGQLWFGSSSGVLVAEPLEPAPAASSTALILEDVLVDGLSAAGFKPVVAGSLQTQATAPLRIGPGRHRVEVQYTSPRFGSSPRFSYRMEDWDRDWVQAGAVRAAQYNHLPPGEYRFSVGLLGADGITSQAAIDLSVIPYFWQRSWVITTGALALLGSAVGCARLVERRRMKIRLRRLQQENALERERTRIAQDLHDEMGAKLCRISFLSEHAGRLDPSSRETREQIATIANDSRDLAQSLDEIVWAVNPHNDTLEHVVSYIAQYAQNYFSGTGVECQLELAERLPTRAVSSQTRHHLFLGVQEALTNILKHSGATRVKVAISYDDPTLCVQVTDDGKGFALAGPGARALNEEPFGDGVPNMRQRMEAVGGQCRVQSEPGRGTSIEFLLELNTPSKEGAKT